MTCQCDIPQSRILGFERSQMLGRMLFCRTQSRPQKIYLKTKKPHDSISPVTRLYQQYNSECSSSICRSSHIVRYAAFTSLPGLPAWRECSHLLKANDFLPGTLRPPRESYSVVMYNIQSDYRTCHETNALFSRKFFYYYWKHQKRPQRLSKGEQQSLFARRLCLDHLGRVMINQP